MKKKRKTLSLKVGMFMNLSEGKKEDNYRLCSRETTWGNLVNGCQERVKTRAWNLLEKRVTRFTGQENINRDELFTAVLSADPVMSHSSLFDS